MILICTTLGEGGKIAESNELASLRETAGLGLRQQALVCVSLSLNTYSSGSEVGEKGFRTATPGVLLTASHDLCLVSLFQDNQRLKTSSIMQSVFPSFI